MTPSTALPAIVRPAHELSGQKYTAQENSPAVSLANSKVETYHARLCQLIAADYRGRAYANTLVFRPDAAEAEQTRAVAWDGLAVRLFGAAAGEEKVVRSADLELARGYQLTLLRDCLADRAKQKIREVAALMELLTAALDARVANVRGVRHAS
jgi:hypothetical protein